MRTMGYQDLPDFPEVPPPSSVRDVELPPDFTQKRAQAPVKTKTNPATSKKFYSDEESEEEESSEEEEEEDEESEEEENTDVESDENTDEEEEKTQDSSDVKNHISKKINNKLISTANGSDGDNASESEESSEEESEEESSSSSSEEEEIKKPVKTKQPPKKHVSLATISPSTISPETDSRPKTVPKPSVVESKPAVPSQKNKSVDMLLDLDDIMSAPTMVMPVHAPILPMGVSAAKSPSGQAKVLAAVFVPNKSVELLSSVTSRGLGMSYKFPRRPFIYSAKMVAIEFTFTNTSQEPLKNIKIVRKKLPPRVEVQDFHEIASLEPNRTLHATLGIDFSDTTQNIGLVIGCNEQEFDVVLKPTVGEMLCPIAMNRDTFDGLKANLSGLNENFANVELPLNAQSKAAVSGVIFEATNVAPVSDVDEGGDGFTLRFVGQTCSSASPVLISIVVKGAKAMVTVNCEKVLVGSMVLKELKDAILNKTVSR